MSDHDDFIGQLEDYLEAFDGVTPLPDRVRDAIRADLPSARQAQPRPGPLRIFTMLLSNASPGARLGLAAATVVVAVALGGAVLNNSQRGGVVGAPPTPAPTPSSAPSSSPTSSPSVAVAAEMLAAAPYVPCDAADTGWSCMAAGTYRLSGTGMWPATVTMDVPAHWFGWEAANGYDGVLLEGGPPAYAGTGWGVMFATVGDVRKDPCDPAKGTIPAAQVNTPEKLAAAMAAWPRFKATAPQPITIDGHSGLKLQLTSTNPSACSATGSVWTTTSGGSMDVYPMIGESNAGAPGTFDIVDTGKGLLVVRTTDFPQTSPAEVAGGIAADPTRHASDQTQLHSIVDSIRIAPLSAAP